MKTQIQTVETNGFSMDCFRFGHGAKTLVVLPGLSVESVMKYAAAVSEAYRLLTDDYTVFVFDRRKEIPETYSVYDMARDTAAALAGPGSVLDSVTPHKQIRFSANTSELTVRGGTMETIMGAWFRNWLESEGLIPENCRPADGEIRFYANSLQRTIASAWHFSVGFLPVADVDIETGAKVVFEKWADPDGNLYARLRLIYASTAQLRSLALLDDENPPVSLVLEFSDLPADADGFYPFEELTARFEKAVEIYDSLPELYGETLENAA